MAMAPRKMGEVPCFRILSFVMVICGVEGGESSELGRGASAVVSGGRGGGALLRGDGEAPDRWGGHRGAKKIRRESFFIHNQWHGGYFFFPKAIESKGGDAFAFILGKSCFCPKAPIAFLPFG